MGKVKCPFKEHNKYCSHRANFKGKKKSLSGYKNIIKCPIYLGSKSLLA